MSLGVAFFFVWVLVQALLPLRRFFRARQSGAPSLLDYDWDHFCWNMKAKASKGTAYFVVYHLQTGEELRVFKGEDFLIDHQVMFLRGHPHAAVPFAHFVHRECGASVDLGVKCFFLMDINERGAREMVEPSVDLARVPIKPFGCYPCLYPER
ncbi:MAG: HTTM domain-containing protein [Chlamydiia bacterium]|nr:HTTM domain-containing protein [Chlamydiia bacterium]